MARCRECGETVSWPKKCCPACGKKIMYPGAGIIAILLCFSFLIFINNALSHDSPQDDLQQNFSAAVESNNEVSSSAFGPGTYTVGTDIASGTYDCVATSGFGVLRGSVAAYGDTGFVQTMGMESDTIECAHEYSNLTLSDGDILYIEMSLNVEFQRK